MELEENYRRDLKQLIDENNVSFYPIPSNNNPNNHNTANNNTTTSSTITTTTTNNNSNGSNGNEQARPKKKEDWDCPQCGDFQFARNDACRKCKTPRPTTAAATTTTKATNNASLNATNNATFGEATNQQQQAQGGAKERKQDWICLKCNDKQFARNVKCRKCGALPPTAESIAQHEAAQLEQAFTRRQREEAARQELAARGERARIEREEQYRVNLAKAEAAGLSRASECWAIRVLQYFDESMLMYPGQASYKCSVTTFDDDYWALTHRPLNERGVSLTLTPATGMFTFQAWRNYDGVVTISEEHLWSESVMLYFVSFVDEFHREFSCDRYDTHLQKYLHRARL